MPEHRELPVAEPTYPPPDKRGRGGAAWAWFGAGVVVLVGAGAGAFVLVSGVAQSSPAAPAGPAFRTVVDRYMEDTVHGVSGPAVVARYVEVALLDAPAVPRLHERPPRAGGAPAVRIRGVTTRTVEAAEPGDAPRRLLFVAYEAREGAAPATRAAETVLAFVESGYRAYPTGAVTLVVWSADGGGRAYAVDFVPGRKPGVAAAAVESTAAGGHVAFALGDPVSGAGRLISAWAEIPAS